MNAQERGSHRPHTAKPATTEPSEAEQAGIVTEDSRPRSGRNELIALLNQRLSEAIDLSMQLKQAHWNVKGPHFLSLHELFDRVHDAIDGYVDQIAERIVQLGGFAEGTVRAAATRSRLADYPLAISDGIAHINAVARALSTFRGEVRNTISEADDFDDNETADLFIEVSRGMDKWLWFVEAHAQGSK